MEKYAFEKITFNPSVDGYTETFKIKLDESFPYLVGFSISRLSDDQELEVRDEFKTIFKRVNGAFYDVDFNTIPKRKMFKPCNIEAKGKNIYLELKQTRLVQGFPPEPCLFLSLLYSDQPGDIANDVLEQYTIPYSHGYGQKPIVMPRNKTVIGIQFYGNNYNTTIMIKDQLGSVVLSKIPTRILNGSLLPNDDAFFPVNFASEGRKYMVELNMEYGNYAMSPDFTGILICKFSND